MYDQNNFHYKFLYEKGGIWISINNLCLQPNLYEDSDEIIVKSNNNINLIKSKKYSKWAFDNFIKNKNNDIETVDNNILSIQEIYHDKIEDIDYHINQNNYLLLDFDYQKKISIYKFEKKTIFDYILKKYYLTITFMCEINNNQNQFKESICSLLDTADKIILLENNYQTTINIYVHNIEKISIVNYNIINKNYNLDTDIIIPFTFDMIYKFDDYNNSNIFRDIIWDNISNYHILKLSYYTFVKNDNFILHKYQIPIINKKFLDKFNIDFSYEDLIKFNSNIKTKIVKN